MQKNEQELGVSRFSGDASECAFPLHADVFVMAEPSRDPRLLCTPLLVRQTRLCCDLLRDRIVPPPDAKIVHIEVRHFPQWDQTLTLLAFEGCEVPAAKKQKEFREDEEELGLQELDGNLRWPSKKRRR